MTTNSWKLPFFHYPHFQYQNEKNFLNQRVDFDIKKILQKSDLIIQFLLLLLYFYTKHQGGAGKACVEQSRSKSQHFCQRGLCLHFSQVKQPTILWPVSNKVILDSNWMPIPTWNGHPVAQWSCNLLFVFYNFFDRHPVAQSTDCIRGKQGYSEGLHLIGLWYCPDVQRSQNSKKNIFAEFTWPSKQRGTHAVIGVATSQAPLHSPGNISICLQLIQTETWTPIAIECSASKLKWPLSRLPIAGGHNLRLLGLGPGQVQGGRSQNIHQPSLQHVQDGFFNFHPPDP